MGCIHFETPYEIKAFDVVYFRLCHPENGDNPKPEKWFQLIQL